MPSSHDYIKDKRNKKIKIFINNKFYSRDKAKSKFKKVNSIITNFHQPKSTLMMMVAAFTQKDFLLEAYQEAIKKKYNFYSYGDSMIVL